MDQSLKEMAEDILEKEKVLLLNTKNAFVVPFFLHTGTGTRLFNFRLKLFLQVDDRFCYGSSLAETKEIDES